MTIEDRIPDMTDKELENLEGNAQRLAQSGAPKQQAEAARLLPIITAARETRRTARSSELAEKKRVRAQELAEARAKKASARKAGASASASPPA